MKRIYIQFLLLLLVSTFSINLQAQRLSIPEKSTVGDEFLIAPDGTYSELRPTLSKNCGCEISDLSFNWSGSFESAVANENLIRLARKRALKKWYSNQINKVVKPAIDRKFGRTFSNFEEAKNELLIDSERKNITTLSRPLRDKYSRLRSRGFKAKEKHLKELKLLKLRESEIKSGNINNPSFGYTKVQGVYLKDIKSLSSLKSKWTPLFDDFSKNIAETHINNHMFKSIGRGVESEVIKLKNQHYNSLNTWDRLSLLQFLIHYEEYKKLSSPPYLVPEHINNMFKKFNNIDKATPELIENLSIKNRTGGFSVFDGRTYYKLLSTYTSPPALPGGEYMAKMEWERLKNQALDKLLNSTSTADFAITNLIGELNITNNTQKNWLYEHKTAANNFIGFANSNRVSNKITNKAQAYIKGQVELEAETQNIPWKSSTGILENNPNLKFTHVYHNHGKNISYYKLTDGSIIASSSYEKVLTSAGDLIDKDISNIGGCQNCRFYYIKLSDNDAWAEMLFTPNNLGDELKTLFALAGKDLGKNLGRYVLPVEDIKILIDGKDFDGQQVARWKAAGGILLTVVPGGKIVGTSAKVLRPVLKVADDVAEWAIVAVKANGKATKLTFKVVGGIVTFGSRSNLAKIIGTKVGEEAHHIIPWADKIINNPIIQKAARAGFHMNAKINGIALKKYSKLIGEGLHGNHPAYNTFVDKKLKAFIDSTSDLTPEIAKDFLENKLIPELLNKIGKAKKSGLNLNDYFKTLL
ncbi:AHH domain-containing protein [Tenacibaculum discolor]|uniref:AHH domain-containing protein n=1 Tax=Tenacibaculum discolor TaxID=361581 RepID=UPI000F5ADA98|nr:AHH domain-containing protein [Tenacibaculum discolor]